MKLTSTTKSELGRQDQRDPAAISRSISAMTYEPSEKQEPKSSNTMKEPTEQMRWQLQDTYYVRGVGKQEEAELQNAAGSS
ncbi:hypothetical protein V496_02517 [Pseudogymnoascus sp. VKM F-4515 (FW-2607)]|nr:hypothetical protein V496_02517 [Pseudogymnoascus sp. VKM F-4515 (FW-2607)]